MAPSHNKGYPSRDAILNLILGENSWTGFATFNQHTFQCDRQPNSTNIQISARLLHHDG